MRSILEGFDGRGRGVVTDVFDQDTTVAGVGKRL
jgi:hypothetical protein